jgi:hypothetical protein
MKSLSTISKKKKKVIFLFILFNFFYFLFFYKDCIFLKYHIFQLLEKKRCKERNNKRKLWKMGEVEEK